MLEMGSGWTLGRVRRRRTTRMRMTRWAGEGLGGESAVLTGIKGSERVDSIKHNPSSKQPWQECVQTTSCWVGRS